MPLNLIKKYPTLLELLALTHPQRMQSLQGIYDRDVVNNDHFHFLGKQIYPTKVDAKIDHDRELWHLTTRGDKGEADTSRTFDIHRAERLHWIRTHIEQNIKDGSVVHVFSAEMRDHAKRENIVRTYIYNETRKYVVVLQPRGDSYYLVTAYYLDEIAGENAMKKRLKKKMSEVL